jgi:integrase
MEHRERQHAERERAANLWHESGFVFTTVLGHPLDGSSVTHRFQKLVAAAGLRRQRFHDLRHACASLLLAQGVSARVVMEILGHSTIALTLNTYSHVLPSTQREALDRMNELLC